MAKDVNIHLKTTGAQKTQADLDKTGQSAKDLGTDVQTGSGQAKGALTGVGDAAKDTSTNVDNVTTKLLTYATAIAAVHTAIRKVTEAINLQKEAIREHASIAAEQQRNLVNLQYLGDFMKEHPEARKEVGAYAEFGRRDFAEVADAWYALESKGAGLSETQKQGIMKEALELGRQEPNADLKGIVEMFSLYMKETRQQDVNLVQNVLRQTVTLAGAEMSQVGQYMPQFMPIGMSGGLTGPEAAGLWAYATTKTKEPSRATVGLSNIFLSLQGKGTPESQELIGGLGITPEMDFFEKLERLATQRQQGTFGLPQAEMIAGKENSAILLSMLVDTEAMMQTIATVSEAARPDIDIVGDQIDTLLGQDKHARIEEEGRRVDVAIANIKGQDLKALGMRVLLKKRELSRRQKGRGDVSIALNNWIDETLLAGGEIVGDIADWVRPSEESQSDMNAEPPESNIPPLEPTPTPPPQSDAGGPVSVNYDNRVIHQSIYNPVSGMNKQDLRMEPPYLG